MEGLCDKGLENVFGCFFKYPVQLAENLDRYVRPQRVWFSRRFGLK